jgi:hypothetical protein
MAGMAMVAMAMVAMAMVRSNYLGQWRIFLRRCLNPIAQEVIVLLFLLLIMV